MLVLQLRSRQSWRHLQTRTVANCIFIGFLNNYRRLIPNLTSLLKPLSQTGNGLVCHVFFKRCWIPKHWHILIFPCCNMLKLLLMVWSMLFHISYQCWKKKTAFVSHRLNKSNRVRSPEYFFFVFTLSTSIYLKGNSLS